MARLRVVGVLYELFGMMCQPRISQTNILHHLTTKGTWIPNEAL